MASAPTLNTLPVSPPMPTIPADFVPTTEQQPLDAIVIGAGPAGVVSLRNLLKAGLKAISIERQFAVGGLWINHTPSYSSLQVLRADWALHGVPCGTDDADQRRFVRDDVCTWVEEYVTTQGIRDCIYLNTEVTNVEPLKPMLFEIDVCSVEKSGYLGGGKRLKESNVKLYARAILVCAGLENHPSIPKFEGIETATFPIKHNWDIRSSDDLPSEDILIVGGGPSSMDIAEEAAITKGAKNVTLATRKPHLGLPDKWGPLLPWAFGARWLWDRSFTEIRVLFKLYRIFPAFFVDWLVGIWSSMWARRYCIPEWKPVDVKFSRDVAFVFRTKLVEPIQNKRLSLQVAGIHKIEGPKVTLTNNVVLYPKILVCATGWTLDLDCLPPTRAKQSFEHVQSRLFCRFWDIDYTGLAFVSLSNGFMCATENANLVSQAVAQVLKGKWEQPSLEYMLDNIEKEVKTGIFVPGKAMVDLERAGFKDLKAGWDYL